MPQDMHIAYGELVSRTHPLTRQQYFDFVGEHVPHESAAEFKATPSSVSHLLPVLRRRVVDGVKQRKRFAAESKKRAETTSVRELMRQEVTS